MAWIILLAAGAMEIGFVMLLAQRGSFTRLWPTIWVMLIGLLSLYLLALAMRGLPVGTAFAIWSAIGAVGATVLGILFRGESANWIRLTGLVTVIAGSVMLRLTE